MGKKVNQSHGGAIYHADKGEVNNPNGRPKKGINYVNEQLKEEGYEPAKKMDIEENYMQLLQLEEEKLKEITQDKNQPMLIRILAKNMLSNKGFEIIEKMLDRGVGKPTQPTEISGEIKHTDENPLKERIQNMQQENPEKVYKSKSKNGANNKKGGSANRK